MTLDGGHGTRWSEGVGELVRSFGAAVPTVEVSRLVSRMSGMKRSVGAISQSLGGTFHQPWGLHGLRQLTIRPQLLESCSFVRLGWAGKPGDH